MFQRAAATGGPNTKQSHICTSSPFRQKASMPPQPLSPQSTSTTNSRPHKTLNKVHNTGDSSAAKEHVLLQNRHIQDSQSRLPLNKQVSDSVYFNEDDFDDDMNFSFETPKAPNKIDNASSPALSWPPSSYLETKSSRMADVMHRQSAEELVNLRSKFTDTMDKVDVDIKPILKFSSSASSASEKKPRILPWTVEKSPSRRLSVPVPQSQIRTSSTSTAVKELDLEEDDVPRLPIKTSALHMTEKAVKLAIKEAKGKKRAADELNATKLHLGTQSHVRSVAQVFLSVEQREVIELIKQGKSVFFTGSAGTGKSVLLREAIKELRQKYQNSEKIGITASTGLAACNIGGITLHSFAGVGLGKEGVIDLVKKVKKAKKNMLRWQKTKVLIIDEISMVDAEFYDKLEAVARKLRANEKPWGGIQIVATGDFFQLPPVPDRGKVSRFSFEAEKWKELDHTIQLTTVFRQKDEGFVMMLNQMRTGQLTTRTIDAFKSLTRTPQYADGMDPTELFPTREEVDRANATRMRAIPGSSQTFFAEDSGQFTGEFREKLLSNCMAPKALELKKGAQVMLIKNRDETLVNGSLGVVIGFMNERLYTFALDEEDGTLDETMLRDSPWTDEELAACEKSPSGKRKMIKLMNMQQNNVSAKVWPVVRFKVPGGRTDIHQLMLPESWKFETPSGEIQACRKQVPLILAYAISIHKAQGQTIERVKVDLGRVFEKGQAYVALSRAVSQEGLQVLRFDAKKVMAHPKVAAFYRELQDVNQIKGKKSSSLQAKSSVYVKAETAEHDTYAPMTTQEVFDQIKREPMKAFSRGSRN